MSTNRILQIACEGSEQTEQLAERLGQKLKGGLVLELISDLGGGKTTFVRGLARGLGSTDHVSSPTFKLSNIYTVTHPAPASLLISRADNPAGFLATSGLTSPVLTSPYLSTARSVLPARTKTGSSAEPVVVPEQKKGKKGDVERLYHYDFYRLPDAGLMGHELHDALSDQNGVVVVEWGKVVAKVLPKDRLSISFIVSGENARYVVIDCPPGLEFVLEGLK